MMDEDVKQGGLGDSIFLRLMISSQMFQPDKSDRDGIEFPLLSLASCHAMCNTKPFLWNDLHFSMP